MRSVILGVLVISAGVWQAASLCGVRFELRLGWNVTKPKDKQIEGCSAGLRPQGGRHQRQRSELWLPEFAIFLTVSDRPTSEVARAAGFDRAGDVREYLPEQLGRLPDDAWVVSGKSWSEADRTDGKTWSGVIGEGVVWTGFKDTRGSQPSP